ncbi:hypothetical protein ACOME3_003248 [Neoechinorhynchus agilis]
MWNVSLIVVGSESPEGRTFIPMDFTAPIPMDFTIADPAQQVSNQKILVFTWRLVKEVAAVLAILFTESIQKTVLKKDVLKQVWDAFICVILTARHHGAFEEVHKQLLHVCRALWHSSDADFNEWPLCALDEIRKEFNSLEMGSHDLRMRTTRRSGGLPLLVHAIVSTSRISQNMDYIDSALASNFIKELNENVLNVPSCSNTEYIEVHSLNVVRVLLRDQIRLSGRQLDKQNGPNLALITLPAVLNRLSSKTSWNVRNAASLLFKCILNLVFGTDRSDGYRISPRNRMQISRFQSLYPYHWQLLREDFFECDHCEDVQFAVLLFVSHLECDQWTTDEIEDCVILFVIRCSLHTRSFRVHRLCAIAIKSLIQPFKCAETVGRIIEHLKLIVERKDFQTAKSVKDNDS